MNEIILDSVVEKLDGHDKKIADLKEKLEHLPDNSDALEQLNTAITGLRDDVQKISFPEKELREFSGRLHVGIGLLKQPVEQKVIHQHHVPKIIWISVGLFLVLCLVSTGWYNTCNNLESYKVNDTKYRYAKLNGGPSFDRWLRQIDSTSSADPNMRNGVIAGEEQNRRNFELWQKSLELEKKAKELKQKISGIRKK